MTYPPTVAVPVDLARELARILRGVKPTGAADEAIVEQGVAVLEGRVHVP